MKKMTPEQNEEYERLVELHLHKMRNRRELERRMRRELDVALNDDRINEGIQMHRCLDAGLSMYKVGTAVGTMNYKLMNEWLQQSEAEYRVRRGRDLEAAKANTFGPGSMVLGHVPQVSVAPFSGVEVQSPIWRMLQEAHSGTFDAVIGPWSWTGHPGDYYVVQTEDGDVPMQIAPDSNGQNVAHLADTVPGWTDHETDAIIALAEGVEK